MTKNIAIKVEDISKVFRLPLEKNNSIKSAVVNFYQRNKSFEEQLVLDKISFEVEKGEFFGIVGRNGSGKSTLLKILAGIYSPSNGSIQINGVLVPFIELGVGFNHELTGRENVYLNGALLGFNRSEMDELYDEIVEFAELSRFMDQKLKNYSSGMLVRLAFSIAIRVKTDILLIDEVLAVGDANFQRKCADVFSNIKASGRTVIFISHDMSAVRKFCDRAIMIQDGKIVDEGTPDKIASTYEVANIDKKKTVKNINEEIAQSKDKIITGIEMLNSEHKHADQYDAGENVTLKISLRKGSLAENIGVAIYTVDGADVFGTNTILDEFIISDSLEYTFAAPHARGEYQLKMGVFGPTDEIVYEFFDTGPHFIVNAKNQKWEGILELPHKWSNV
jgi:ABC-2 type transport system ATP-binding protein